MNNYEQFACVYDRLMTDVNYIRRTKYLLKLFKKFGKIPILLLDLACGTGGFSNEFANLGIDVIGVDMSEEMLSVARMNSANHGTDVLFLCQKAEELDLYGTVDGAVCCMDSINHITNKKNLKSAFKKVSLFLEKDSLFIFDVNTPYKHEKILGNNTFVFEENGIYSVWVNRYNNKTGIVDINLDFFEKTGENYSRHSADFSERSYTFDELNKMLEETGFKVEAVYDDMTEEPVEEMSERAIYIAKKL